MQTFKQPLSKTEEEYFLHLYLGEDSRKREWAKEVLIEHNLRLVAHIAKKYQASDVEMEDLISIGTVGLIKAVMSFDRSKNSKLGTYSARCIENAILSQIDKEKGVRGMVSLMTVMACVITLLISLVLPFAVLLGMEIKNKRQGIASAWFLGAAGFFVTQILIRLPLLTVLQSLEGFAAFAQNNPFLYAFGLAFTAGLFELAGRLGVAKLLEKKMTWKRALAAGLGHGGIEAVLLIGMTYINNLLFIVLINTGLFDKLIAMTADSAVVAEQLELIRTQLVGVSPVLFLLAGYERILTMIGHTAMSVLVCYGIAHKKLGICVLLCLGLHTLTDLTAGLTLVLPQETVYPVIYTILTVMAVIYVVILREVRRRWKD